MPNIFDLISGNRNYPGQACESIYFYREEVRTLGSFVSEDSWWHRHRGQHVRRDPGGPDPGKFHTHGCADTYMDSMFIHSEAHRDTDTTHTIYTRPLPMDRYRHKIHPTYTPMDTHSAP